MTHERRETLEKAISRRQQRPAAGLYEIAADAPCHHQLREKWGILDK